MSKRPSEIGNLEENSQLFVRRERRRRNCLTETTRIRRRRRALIKSRSRLRSSSRVTRYCDWPTMAASKISLSSGSRHIFRSPEICTTLARAAISRTNVSAFSAGYLNRRVIRGRLRTSTISASCERDVTTPKSSRRHLVITRPGGPVGFRKDFDRLLRRMRSRTKAISQGGIEAEVSQARAEVKAQHRAARRPA